MQHLLPRLSIAILVSTLAIGYDRPAMATPKPKLVASEIIERVTAANDRSKQSGLEIFASSTSKSAIRPKKNIRSTAKGLYPSRVVTIGNKSLRGIANLTNPNLDRLDRSSPVNRLIK